MSQLSLKFLGADHLPAKLSEFDLDRLFCLTPEEIAEVRRRFRREHQVAASIQLVFLRAAGRAFDADESVPRQLLGHLGRQLKCEAPNIATLRALYRRRDTLNQHQQWARAWLELNYPTDHQLRMLYVRLREQADQALSIEALVRFGARWLYRAKLIIPSERTLRQVAVRAFVESQTKIAATLAARISKEALNAWMEKLYALRVPSAMTYLEWLQTPPGKRSPSTLSEAFKRVQFLKDLGIHRLAFEGIPTEKQRMYAKRLAARRPSTARKRPGRMALVEFACFLNVALLDWTDTVLQLAGMRILDIVRRAKQRGHSRRLACAADDHSRLVALKTLLADTTRSAQARIDEANALLADIDTAPVTQAAALRAVLSEDRGRVRVLLHHLAQLQPQGEANDAHLNNLHVLEQHYHTKRYQLPTDSGTSASPAWQSLVDDADRGRAFRALEGATLLGLHKSVRRGTVWVEHSLSFRHRDQLLIGEAHWPLARTRHLTELKLPAEPDKFLTPILAAVKVGLAAVDEALQKGDLTIDDAGALHLAPLAA